MVTLTTYETDLIDQLLDVLEETIEDISTVDIKFANKTKIQKLLYYAIDEFDIPITYSWYLAGAVVPDRSIGPDSLQNSSTTPSEPDGPKISAGSDSIGAEDNNPSADAKIGDEVENSSESIDPVMFTEFSDQTEDNMFSEDTHGGSDDPDIDPELSTYVDRDELASFYKTLLPDVWREQTMRFLQNFYQEMAPEQFRLLYIESTHLRTHLTELISVIEDQVNGRQSSKSVKSLRESIELSISDFHYHLRKDKTLGQTFDVVIEGTNLVEDAIMCLDRIKSEDINETHLNLLKKLKEFFFYYVWKYPCLLISEKTATGPKADDLRDERRNEFETFPRRLKNKRAEISNELAEADLLPGPTDYPSFEDNQMSETLTDLSTEYFE